MRATAVTLDMYTCNYMYTYCSVILSAVQLAVISHEAAFILYM